MTEFNISPSHFGRWLHQNKAEYTGNFVEGVLLDNFVVATKRGFAAIYEKPLNPNQSWYHVVFEAGTAQNMFSQWYEFEQAAEEDYV